MKILDAHVHLGEDCVFDEEQTEQDILNTCETYGVTGGVVQPFVPRMYVKDTMEIHDRIAAFCKAHPSRFYGMMSMNPHFSHADYEAEADRCMQQLGFVAIKITPIAHAANPSKNDSIFVCEMARKHHVPVMVHTGAGIPFADPMQMTRAIEAFPDVEFIIAHGGTDNMCGSAIYLAQKYENVYVEPSWLAIHNLMGMYRKIGASKMMFSSDMCVNLPVELCKYNLVFQKEEDREQVFHRTLETVFRIPG